MQRKRSSLKREEDNCLEFYSVISVLLKRVSEGFFGDLSDEVIPGPIPNPVVKLVSADGSTWVTACKSRSLPENPFLLFSPRLSFPHFLKHQLNRRLGSEIRPLTSESEFSLIHRPKA